MLAKIIRLLAFIVSMYLLCACSQAYPDQEEMAAALMEAMPAETVVASQIKNLHCDTTGDGIIMCKYNIGTISYLHVMDQSLTGQWSIHSNNIITH